MARRGRPKSQKSEPSTSIIPYYPDAEQYQNEEGKGNWYSYQDRRRYVTLMRDIEVLEYRLSGYTYEEIAYMTGFKTPAGPRKAYDRAMKRLAAESNERAERLRREEEVRYQLLMRGAMAKAIQGDLKAIDRVIKISKARRDLWGLDAPEQVDITLLLRQAAEAEGLDPDEVVAEAMKIMQED